MNYSFHFKKNTQLIINTGIFLFLLSLSSFAKPPHDFQQAKRQATAIFDSHRETLYCGCTYNQQHQIDLASCHMNAAQTHKRAARVEWEHMMPAENFGKQFKCWREAVCRKDGKPYKGRRCCEKIDPDFKQAEAELYNLWPAEGVVNQARSNYRYAELAGNTDFLGCSFKIDRKLRQVEPDDHIKGVVARANLFMADKYNIKLSAAQRQLFEIWDKRFPPDAWEKQWASKVAAIEGYSNPYIHAWTRVTA
ncbi:endonuclease [Legionella feeleii]|uniref:Putative endonuclease-1 n=1 Tax=Legionella feeleii TaxID=453 RepID=A0A378IU00_9GAMM|nr:endonuclease [Legionella feeleii]STX38686.1 putative endonuclease-1 [Legionella feeleii]